MGIDMTREEKIAKIYEKIADKTLSFGCILKESYEGKDYIHTILELINENKYYYYVRILDGTGNFNKKKTEIIGHPVMIGDCLSYFNEKTIGVDYTTNDILKFWTKKRKSIEEQSEECIDYVFNLLPKE